ncbi:hypothetical protein [Suipraeoptans intestinalis]|uniref:hypothetical protein n=1 Tax=Suipraeoptans intestinalis TaxID=2606628 RepID=UPI002FE6E261
MLKKVREYNKTLNIILLTARSDVSDRVKGLDFEPTTTWSSPSILRSWKPGYGPC